MPEEQSMHIAGLNQSLVFSGKENMAASPICPKTGFHARSNSLPSRPHPLISQFDEHMCRLRDSQLTSTSLSSIGSKLSSLQDLHGCVDKLLQLPLTQKALAQELHQKCVDEVLDESLRLLDVCNTTKDALLQIKESIYELQSTIRRRQGGLMDNEVRRYIASKKALEKAIKKALKNTKGVENKSTKDDKDNVTMMLREVETITLTVFDSLLSFISEPKSQSNPRRWSSFSRLMHPKRVACEEEETSKNEFAMVNAALESFISCKTSKSVNTILMENVQKKLNSLELCIQDLEDGVECLFRRMIKTRASLLNMFNN